MFITPENVFWWVFGGCLIVGFIAIGVLWRLRWRVLTRWDQRLNAFLCVAIVLAITLFVSAGVSASLTLTCGGDDQREVGNVCARLDAHGSVIEVAGSGTHWNKDMKVIPISRSYTALRVARYSPSDARREKAVEQDLVCNLHVEVTDFRRMVGMIFVGDVRFEAERQRGVLGKDDVTFRRMALPAIATLERRCAGNLLKVSENGEVAVPEGFISSAQEQLNQLPAYQGRGLHFSVWLSW